MEEIAMKKSKTVVDLLAVADVCIEASEARTRLWNPRARGPKGRRIVGSTQLTEAITRTEETVDIAASNPRSRWRRSLFDVPIT
jgi:hypothetical protein